MTTVKPLRTALVVDDEPLLRDPARHAFDACAGPPGDVVPPAPEALGEPVSVDRMAKWRRKLMARMNCGLVLAISLPLLASCLTGNESGHEDAAKELTNEAVMAMVYDPGYSVPRGFLVDVRADTQGSYTIYHVKDPSISYELCTDDHAQALEWEAEDSDSRDVNGVFIASTDTEKYFEVVRELEYADSIGNVTDPTSPGYFRILKCSYANRDGVDRNLRNGFAGVINVLPLTQPVVRDYVEYFWQFTFFWPARKSVLASVGVETDAAYVQTLVLGFLTRQGSDRCDLIEIVDWTFSVSRTTGEVSKSFRLRRAFEAELVGGQPMICVP